jgi:hypothetical protein
VDDGLDVVESNASPAWNGLLPAYHLEQETPTECQASIVAGSACTISTIENGNVLPEYSRGSWQVNEWPAATVPPILSCRISSRNRTIITTSHQHTPTNTLSGCLLVLL